MDHTIKEYLKELPRLSQTVMNNLYTTIRALALVNIHSPEYIIALNNSKEANLQAELLIKKQREVINSMNRKYR